MSGGGDQSAREEEGHPAEDSAGRERRRRLEEEDQKKKIRRRRSEEEDQKKKTQGLEESDISAEVLSLTPPATLPAELSSLAAGRSPRKRIASPGIAQIAAEATGFDQTLGFVGNYKTYLCLQ